MRGSSFYILLLALAAASPAMGLTLYKCVLLDGSGVIYQEDKPSATECRIETKNLNPDANVIPAADFIGGKEPGDVPGDDSDTPAAMQEDGGGTGANSTTKP